MLKVLINGCNGKMGQVVAEEIAITPDVETLCGFDRVDTGDNNFPVFTNIEDINLIPDVIIDFSHPSSLTGILKYAVDTKTPVVVCTTGLSDEQKDEIKKASEYVAVFYSANMSLGISVITKLASLAKEALGFDYDIEIIEKHHNQKLDAPSGTALAIAESLNENQEYDFVYERESRREKRHKSEIGIHAVRGGTIVGEHTVIFAGKDEVIEIKHSAASKEIFATGAVRAAGFLSGKPAGMYSMKDLVNSI